MFGRVLYIAAITVAVAAVAAQCGLWWALLYPGGH